MRPRRTATLQRRGPLHEAFEDARSRWDALDESQREGGVAADVEDALAECAYALRVFGAIRAQMPMIGRDENVAIVGPASITVDHVAAVARNAVEDLAESLREPPAPDGDRRSGAGEAAAAPAAWGCGLHGVRDALLTTGVRCTLDRREWRRAVGDLA
jgi:hypothetical protein